MNNPATIQPCGLEINVLVKQFSRVCIFLFVQSYKSSCATSLHCIQTVHLPTVYHAPSSQRPSHILLYLRLVPHLGRKETLGSCLCISKSPNLKRHVPKSVYSSRHFSTTVVHFQISYNKKLKYQILYPIIIC